MALIFISAFSERPKSIKVANSRDRTIDTIKINAQYTDGWPHYLNQTIESQLFCRHGDINTIDVVVSAE